VFWLVFFWIIPVAFVGSLTTLQALSAKVPFLEPVANSSSIVKGFLQGFLPTLALVIFMALLPRILLELSKVAGVEAYSWQSMSVLNYFFYFQVFNVFLVSVISGSIFDSLSSIISSPTSVVDLLGQSLPKVSNFFINYIMIQSFTGFSLQLLQLPRLILGSIFAKRSVNERERLEAEASPTIDYGTDFPMALLVFMISLAYATISPLILAFAAIYFGYGALSNLYMVLYVCVPDYESGGLFWPMVFSRCVVAIIIAQLTIIGLFGIKLAPTQASLSAVLPFMSLLFYNYITTVFNSKSSLLPMELAIQVDDDSKKDDDKKDGKGIEGEREREGIQLSSSTSISSKSPPPYTNPALLCRWEESNGSHNAPNDDDTPASPLVAQRSSVQDSGRHRLPASQPKDVETGASGAS